MQDIPRPASRRLHARGTARQGPERAGGPDITVRAVTSRGNTTYSVLVTSTAGKRFRLGAPVAGGVMSDRQFAAKVQQIQEYWRAATGSADTGHVGQSAIATDPARTVRVDASPVILARLTRWCGAPA
jgi:hypothetical protein